MGANLRWITEKAKLDDAFREYRRKCANGTATQADYDEYKSWEDDFNRRVEKHNNKVLAASNKKGCFISTVVLSALGKGDDCVELSLLRTFRDDVLLSNPEGRMLVNTYYMVSPDILERLEDRAASEPAIYVEIYHKFLRRVLDCIQEGNHEQAVDIYKHMVCCLGSEN